MFAILAGGALVNRHWQTGLAANDQAGAGASAAFNSLLGGSANSRLAALTGSPDNWLITAVALITVAALAIFMIRHSLLFHKVVVKSEHYVSKHPMLDISAVMVFTAGFVLIG